MIINGQHVPNITCGPCGHRHPASISCREAQRLADEARAKRVTVEVDFETHSEVPLSESPLAASVDRDRHNEAVLVTRGGAEAMRQLALLAIDIALGCPLDRPSQPGYYTYVSRDTVREIRSVLETAGIPWKLQHKELRK